MRDRHASSVRSVRFDGAEAAAPAPACSRPSRTPRSWSSPRPTRWCRSTRCWRCPACARRSQRRRDRWWPSARSSAARRSRAPPTGCCANSATSPRSWASPAGTPPRRHARHRRGRRRLAAEVEAEGMRCVVTDTIMRSPVLGRTALPDAAAAGGRRRARTAGPNGPRGLRGRRHRRDPAGATTWPAHREAWPPSAEPSCATTTSWWSPRRWCPRPRAPWSPSTPTTRWPQASGERSRCASCGAGAS